MLKYNYILSNVFATVIFHIHSWWSGLWYVSAVDDKINFVHDDGKQEGGWACSSSFTSFCDSRRSDSTLRSFARRDSSARGSCLDVSSRRPAHATPTAGSSSSEKSKSRKSRKRSKARHRAGL